MKSSNQTSPNTITNSNTTLAGPITIANALNKYFSTIALDIQSSIRYLKNSFLASSHQ